MPKRRILDNTSEWGKKMRREMNKEREAQAKYEIYLDKLENREKVSDFVNDPLQMNEIEKKLQKHFEECRKKKKSRKKKLLFITLNWNEKLVTPTGTVAYVHKIIHHPKVTKYYATWEWRDNQEETGLHTHIILLGNTKELVQYCKRQKGPFVKLCPEFHTIKKYPEDYWDDKVGYLEAETYDDEKNELKKGYQRLRDKHRLPTLKSI